MTLISNAVRRRLPSGKGSVAIIVNVTVRMRCEQRELLKDVGVTVDRLRRRLQFLWDGMH